MSSKKTMLAAAILAAIPLTASAATITYTYVTGQISTTSNFATVTTVSLTGATPTVNLTANEYFRYNLSIAVTGNANPNAGGVYDTAEQGNGGPTAPGNLGLATVSLTTTTDGGLTTYLKPTTAPTINGSLPSPALSTGGAIAAGALTGTGLGYFASTPTATGDYSNYTNLSVFTSTTSLFTRAVFESGTTSGTTHLTTSATTLQVFTSTHTGDGTQDGSGNFTNPDTYGSRNASAALGDTIVGPNPITVNVTAGPSAVYNYAYDAGTVATTLGGSSAGSLGISSPAPGYYTDSPVLSGLTSAKGYVTLTTADTGANTNKLGIGAETPVFVLIDYNLGTTSLATLEADLTAVAGSQTASIFTSAQDTTGQFAKLQAIYGTTLFPSASSLLFELTGATASTPNFGWDLTGSGVTVANVVAVPEPASIGLLALGALGLIGRRRSSK